MHGGPAASQTDIVSSSPPSISLMKVLLAYIEGDGAKVLLSDLSVARGVDSSGNPTDIESATVTVSGAPVSGEDVLAFTDQNGITGVLGSGAQTTLTLSATSPFPTTAVWEQALESITYENTSDAPSLNTRILDISITDSAPSTDSKSSAFSITSVNDAPTIGTTAGSTVLENSGNTSTTVGVVNASDVDDTVLTYSITNGDPNNFFLIDSIGNITLTTSGVVEVNKNDLVTTTYTLEITVADDETPTPASITSSVTVIFEAVNDPPTLFGSSIFIDEGATLTLSPSEIVVSDVDDNLSNVSIAISNLSSTLSIVVAGSPVTSFTAQQLTDGDVSLVHDGSEPMTASFGLTPEDGDEDSSTPATETLFVSVTPINDPPLITDAGGTLAYTEEDPAAVIDATLSISDAENDQLQSATVTISSGYQPSEDALNFDSASASSLGITGSFASGTLTLSGGSSAINYETILESVTYQNSNEINPSTTNRTVTWTVSDGSDNSTAATSTITVTAVDDGSRFGGDISGTGEEDASISGTLSVTDPEGIASVSIDVQAVGGSASIDAQESVGSASITDSDTVFVGIWQYTPDTNKNGYDRFTVKVTDNLGNTATQTITLDVIPVDDPPVAESKSLTVAEDSRGTGLGLLKPITVDPEETLVITVTQVPLSSEGVIDNAGASLSASSTLTPTELAGLTFTPNANYDGAVTDFVYLLSDGTGSDDSTGTVSISITAVDDPPVAESKSLTVAEDSP
ncbi:MAG: tandem-95 repeat protein, partial [Pseudomonadota bacterium]|nr:tandem-95 repeat protein [Pseudomonadota bacterium]